MTKTQAINEAMRRAKVLKRAYVVYGNPTTNEFILMTRDRPRPKGYEYEITVLPDDE